MMRMIGVSLVRQISAGTTLMRRITRDYNVKTWLLMKAKFPIEAANTTVTVSAGNEKATSE